MKCNNENTATPFLSGLSDNSESDVIVCVLMEMQIYNKRDHFIYETMERDLKTTALIIDESI